MTRAVCPGSHRRFCYLDDEAARQQAAAIAKCDEAAEAHSIRALLAWLGVLAVSCGAALARILQGVMQ